MAEETKYIPYGQDEISQQELQTALANDLPNFMNKYKWLQKPKNRDTFLKIYSDMVNGLTGASNDSGLWSINTSNDMNSYLMSPREKEIAEHSAYYIQQQMAKMTPRKKEEEKKADKKSYDNKEFQSGITNYIGQDRFGGRESKEWAQDWLDLDSNTNGIYSTTKRQSELAKYLGLYRDKIKLEQDKYDFTTGPYGSYDEFNSRIERAIAALNNPEWNQEDIDSLNKLGLDREAWLATGANTPVIITDAEGNQKTITREEYNKLQEEQKLQEEKNKIEEENKRKQILNQNIRNNINWYRGIYTYAPNQNTFKINDFKNAQSAEDIVAHVRNNFAKITSNDEFRKRSNEILGAYKILGENRKLKPISDEIWNNLNKSKKFSEDKGRGQDKSKFMQLDGIDNIVYDSESRKVYYLDKEVPVKRMLDTVQKYRKAQMETYINTLNGGRIYKYGGSIKNLDTIIEDFIKNNNI